MNGYELVRKQPKQDSEISKRLPLTGGTVTGITSFTKVYNQVLQLIGIYLKLALQHLKVLIFIMTL